MANQNSIQSTLSSFSRHLYARRGLSEVTVHNYISAIRRLVPVVSLDPTPKAIEQHIEHMHKSGASYSHIVNTSIALEAYCAFRGRHIKLGRPRKPRHLVRGTLSEAEITLLIAAARTLRDRAMIVTLAYAGIRNRELCRMRVGDVDLAGHTLHVQATKTQKDRYTHIAAPCVSVLAEYMRERGGQAGDLLFVCLRSGKPYAQQNLRKTIRTAARRAHLKKRVYPHLLRHSLATNLLHRGAHLLFILTIGQCSNSQAQRNSASTSSVTGKTVQIPQTHVYHHLFRYVLHLESLRPTGEDNPFMTDIAGRVLEIDPSQLTLIQKEAHLCEADVAPIDAQAQQLIANIKKLYPGGIVADASQLPKPPDALIALQRQRDAVIQRHVDTLQQALVTSAFAHLDSNLKTRFAQHIHGNTLPLAVRSTSGPRKPQLLQGK
jgi:integrase/recombinase XerD